MHSRGRGFGSWYVIKRVAMSDAVYFALFLEWNVLYIYIMIFYKIMFTRGRGIDSTLPLVNKCAFVAFMIIGSN